MRFIPFHVNLTTTFRGVSKRSGVLIEGTDEAGATHWGEYSPFPDYNAERSSRWWRAAMEAATGAWPEPIRQTVPVNAIVPLVPPQDVARYATAHGCRTAKVKVGGPGTCLRDDIARVEAAAAALAAGGTDGKIRIDANGSWDVDEAVIAINELDRAAQTGGLAGLEYVEQPCSEVADLAVVRRRINVPVAADESVRIPGDVSAVLAAEAADIIVLKANPMGGVRACLELAEQAGKAIVVSSAMESSVGLAAGVALALALPEAPYAHGLGTGALLATDTVARSIVAIDGQLGPASLEVIA